MDYGFAHNKKIFDDNLQADTGGEYILPDYLPDIKKILHVFTSAHETGRALDGEKLSTEGEAEYRVLYSTDNGMIKSVSYTSAYGNSQNVKGMTDSASVFTSVCVPDTTARLLNPRKLLLRSRVASHIRVFVPERDEPFIEGVQDVGLQYRYADASAYTVCGGADTGVAASEDITLPAALPEASELFGVYLFPTVSEAVASDGSVTVRGEAVAVIVYANENDGAYSYHTYTAKIPITRVVTVKEAQPGDECGAEIRIYGIEADAAVDSAGEKRVIEIDFNYDVNVCCEKNSVFSYVKDMYSATHESLTTYKTSEVSVLQKIASFHFTQNAKAPLSVLGASAPDEILFATADCSACSVMSGDGSAVIEGSVEISLVSLRGGEAEGGGFEAPFRTEADTGGASKNAVISCDCRAGAPKVRFDGESVYADLEIYVTLHAVDSEELSYAANVTISDEPVIREDASILLYYPQPGEDVWQAAKKYRVPPDALKAANKLETDTLPEKRPIRIPKL